MITFTTQVFRMYLDSLGPALVSVGNIRSNKPCRVGVCLVLIIKICFNHSIAAINVIWLVCSPIP